LTAATRHPDRRSVSGAQNISRVGACNQNSRVAAALASFCSSLSQRLARELTAEPHGSYDELLAAFSSGALELSWMPPLLLARAMARGGTLLAVPQRAGSLMFRAAILVHANGPLHDVAELAGQRAAWVDRSSASGYLFPRLELTRQGLGGERPFTSETFYGSTLRAAAAVAAGEADLCSCFVTEAAAHDRFHALDDLSRALGPLAEQLRLVHVTGLIPPDGLVASPALPAAEREPLQRALLTLHESATGQQALLALLQASRLCAPTASISSSLATWA